VIERGVLLVEGKGKERWVGAGRTLDEEGGCCSIDPHQATYDQGEERHQQGVEMMEGEYRGELCVWMIPLPFAESPSWPIYHEAK
jgi:hypothetical protein